MARSCKNKNWIPPCLWTALLVVMLVYPPAAGAYAARSAAPAVPGYGAARSQPQYRSDSLFPVPSYTCLLYTSRCV